ncbi:hypothetical protein [Companilactobacillus halodurans]|uniref:Glycosyl hydrolase family 8 n=1 Tax=Companilactobacillus halodurans TaxID=2584183 RepID=A0A5P0ZTH1_9LACO|nr:hypothetical protein [Companilactobacillus halodurans]MQS75583.1 hypothetical protein [Companilactobacillus halodurans]MQS96297.1 hypothetical protein [Companilactobacillus halodurans]
MKRKVLLALSLLFFLLMSGCINRKIDYQIPTSKSQFIHQGNHNRYQSQEKMLREFIENKLVTKKGIYTNFKQQKVSKDSASGHEMLSESSGLWLEYLAYTHQYQKFRQFYQATKETFNQKTQFSYRYDPKTNKLNNVNATLDDLRIIRALQIYADLTNSKSFKKEAAKRFAMLKKNTMSNGKIASFYDVKSKEDSAEGSLSYYDLMTLKYFESVSKKSKKMYRQQLEVVESGYLGDAFPLYANYYDWSDKSYSQDNLNTSESLETILHLSEVKKVKEASLNWLEHQVDNDTLYNSYSVNGGVIDKEHSAGSYALAAMIFSRENNSKMYHRAMGLVLKYQVTDKSSAIYGGIGIGQKNEAYSYNNLMALMASKY